MRIGIDFGGVLCVPDVASQQRGLTPRFTCGQGLTPGVTQLDMPHALEALSWLKEQGHSLHLISSRSRESARETFRAMERAGVLPLFDSVNFLSDHQGKGRVCDDLGLDVLIDDRADVLAEVVSTTEGRTHPLQMINSNPQQAWQKVIWQIFEMEEFLAESSSAHIPCATSPMKPLCFFFEVTDSPRGTKCHFFISMPVD